MGVERGSARGPGLGAQRGGLVRAAEPVEENNVVLADGRQGRMVRWQALLEDRDGALEERLGLGVAVGGLVEPGEVVEPGGEVRMVRPERLLADGQGALV